MNQEKKPSYDLILLAGSDNKSGKPSFEEEIGGKSLIEWVLESLSAASSVSRIFAVGPVNVVGKYLDKVGKEIRAVESNQSFWRNLELGIDTQQKHGSGQRVLIAYSDLPFLQSHTIDRFAEEGNVGEIAVPLVPQSAFLALKGIYESYYWPMREFPFKWGDLTHTNVSVVDNEISQFADEYRRTWTDVRIKTIWKRLALLSKYGGTEAMFTLGVNYFSKALQMKRSWKAIPLSNLRTLDQYQRLLARSVGADLRLVKAPYVDFALDVDNENRLALFRRGHKQMRAAIELAD